MRSVCYYQGKSFFISDADRASLEDVHAAASHEGRTRLFTFTPLEMNQDITLAVGIGIPLLFARAHG